jgi:Tol biopolymer transport system component
LAPQGEPQLVPDEPNWASPPNGGLAISPDGQWLAFDAMGDDGRTDVWIRSLAASQPATRLTFEGEWNRRPSWTPDGKSVVFLSPREGGGEAVWVRRADGTERARPLLSRSRRIFEALVSPDGDWLVYRTADEGGVGRGDILAVRLGQDSIEIEVAATEAEETSPALSPDGRWLAYASAMSGRKEIYVVPFPNVRDGGPWQVSTTGGTEPVWSHSGSELFYRSGSGWLTSVEIATEQGFAQVSQRTLMEVLVHVTNGDHRMYAVAPDDEAFLFLRPLGFRAGESYLVLVENWLQEIEALVGN